VDLNQSKLMRYKYAINYEMRGSNLSLHAVGVTSDHKDQIKPLCGACRQLYMYVNPMTTIYVFGKDKKVKLKVKLIDTMKYPYISSGKIT
jgi:cytidine deaminase